MEQPNYYSILPADVRYNENLTANEKILYSEITALTVSTGECWAGNEYFARLYNLSTRSITRMIKNLKDNGLIEIELVRRDNCKEIEKRIIRLRGIDKNVVGYRHLCQGGIDKNVLENNTSNNIKNEYINNTPPPKEEKHKYGIYQHVFLTDEQYEKLKQDFPTKYEKLINDLDEGIELKGYSYKNHYLAIRKWEARDKERSNTPYRKQGFNEDYVNERNKRMLERYAKLEQQEQEKKVDVNAQAKMRDITKNLF